MDDLRQDSAVSADPLALVEVLIHSGKLTEARLDSALAEAGLSVPKWMALKRLVQAGEPLPLGQLAERLTCVKSNATQLVDRLEAEGLVRRTPDPGDRRIIRAEVTAEGRRRYEAGDAALQTSCSSLLNGYTAAERQMLGELLARLSSSYNQS